MPFASASKDDRWYQHLARGGNGIDYVWKIHEENKPGFFSVEFMALVQSMLAFEPRERPSAADILSNAWLNDDEGLTVEQITAKPARKRDQKKTLIHAGTHQKMMSPRGNNEKQIRKLPQTSVQKVDQPSPIKQDEL